MSDVVLFFGEKHPARLFIREWMNRPGHTKITQEKLAEFTNHSPGTISKLLSGEMKITGKYLGEFADALDVSVPDLFRDPNKLTAEQLLEEMRRTLNQEPVKKTGT